MADFEHVRIEQASPDVSRSDMARHADNIIATNRALRVASTACAKEESEKGDTDSTDVVAEYGQFLKGPLAFIIRGEILFDAEELPYDKQVIRSALVNCARRQSLRDDERASLGDLHFYLSYFIERMEEREDDPSVDFFAEQRAEGLALRSEWQRVAGRQPSKVSQFLASWLKPNA